MVTKAKNIARSRDENANTLCLDLGRGSRKIYSDLTKALQALHKPSEWVLKDVRFIFNDAGVHFHSKELDALVQAVPISSLEKAMFATIDVDTDHQPQVLWSSPIISKLLAKTRTHLKELKIVNSGIVCKDDEELQQFYQAIEGMTNLDSCQLGDSFNIHMGTDDEYLSRISLTTFYSKIPATKTVSIPLKAPYGNKRVNDFRHFFRNQTLQFLKVAKLRPADQYAMMDLAEGLGTAQNLKVLKINFKWYTGYVLEEDPTGPHWTSWQRLAESIAASTTLEEVDIIFDSDEFDYDVPVSKLDQFILLLARKIAENQQTSLKKLCIGPCPEHFEKKDTPRELFKAFIELLETNMTIETLHGFIDADDFGLAWYIEEMEYYELDDELNMYLKLNKHGRKRLMENPNGIPLQDWTNVFAKLKDHACTNYYLARFPWLTQTGYQITEKDEYDDY